ncbi:MULTISPECIES: hypothetical protein [Sphingomonas]|jgi:hypothetical protein|uniref:hypothetical protein n=1 Tax=Sphingomonas TaxID=13687 RepID=UPI00234EEE94|nr:MULTISPECIES: hypothetical protein [Sphingomonas]WCP71720.1 hypothetical protein PPZ50_15430 [Sphingomonas hankookensis]
MIGRTFVLAAVLALAATAAEPRSSRTPSFPTACRAAVPARYAGEPAQWLGDCVKNRAEGLGVLRIGRGAPFAFLVGRMKAGRPASGLLFNPDKSYAAARGFTADGRILPADGNYLKEQDQAWADAVLAARQVGDRFVKAGNAASAAYYRRFASEIENGRPE